ncbi:TonB-dependent receptor domain-containing protein [Pleomorphovibrio marinus]|uniref:TonB-dependent receptor domain-containing protein n=1 Tax=Pleomorphovibrio marinus TaxID=2164132 RepID=UPI000E0B74ED|nr:TonB-dependent receptor [Pleomorphovibrio marinus]
MKCQVILILLFTFYFDTYAQIQVSGHVQNTHGEPMAFANVMLLSVGDSTMLKGDVSDDKGRFQLYHQESETCLLVVSALGYSPFFQSISRSDPNPELAPIILSESETELETVTVSAKKPLVEKHSDRLVVNVQESITMAGATVLEVLSRSPGVFLNAQQGNLSLNGKDGVLVMINDVINRMPLATLLQLLEGMSAANIERLELITHPPAHMEAEGAGGIIHIVMKENLDEGTSGDMGIMVGALRRELFGANGSISHRRGKWAINVNSSYNHLRNIQVFDNAFMARPSSSIPVDFKSGVERIQSNKTLQFRAAIEKSFDNNASVGAIFSFNNSFQPVDNLGISFYQAADSMLSTRLNYLDRKNIHNLNAHLHYIKRIKEKHLIRLDYDYLNLGMNAPSTYDHVRQYGSGKSERVKMGIDSDTPMSFHIASMDFETTQFKHLILRVGIKKTWMNFENTVDAFEGEEPDKLPIPAISMRATMKEEVAGAYMSGNWSPVPGFNLNAGLRYEHTITDIQREEVSNYIYRDFGNFFPNLSLEKSIGEHLGLMGGYAKRINRPTLNQLVPAVFMFNENSHFFGNAELLPAVINNYHFTLKWKNASLGIEHSHLLNSLVRHQPSFDPQRDVVIYNSQNLEHHEISSLNFNAPWIITPFWDLQSTVQLQRNHMKASHMGAYLWHTIYNLHFNLNNSFDMGNGWSGEMVWIYDSRRNMGIWRFSPISVINFGIRKQLKANQGTINLSVTDILNTQNFFLATELPYPSFSTNFDLYLRMRGIRINYIKRFGHSKMKAIKVESASEEDKKRVDL